jgi:hypothetical protein
MQFKCSTLNLIKSQLSMSKQFVVGKCRGEKHLIFKFLFEL